MIAPFPPTSFDGYAMEHSTLAAIQLFRPRADWRHAGRRGVRWNVVGDIPHESGVKLHINFAQCVSPAEAEFWAAIWPPAASIICTFGHGFPVGGRPEPDQQDRPILASGRMGRFSR
jgi:hypothetical protein